MNSNLSKNPSNSLKENWIFNLNSNSSKHPSNRYTILFVFYFSKNFFFKQKNHPPTNLATSSNLFKHAWQLLYNIYISYIFKKKNFKLLKPLPTYSNILFNIITPISSEIINRVLVKNRDNDHRRRTHAEVWLRQTAYNKRKTARKGTSRDTWPLIKYRIGVGRVVERQIHGRIFTQTVRTDFHGNRKQGSGR